MSHPLNVPMSQFVSVMVRLVTQWFCKPHSAPMCLRVPLTAWKTDNERILQSQFALTLNPLQSPMPPKNRVDLMGRIFCIYQKQ